MLFRSYIYVVFYFFIIGGQKKEKKRKYKKKLQLLPNEKRICGKEKHLDQKNPFYNNIVLFL